MATLDAKIETRFGDLVDGRIYQSGQQPKQQTPYIDYICGVSRTVFYTHDGASKLARYRVQMSVFSENLNQAKGIRDGIETAMENWHEEDSRVSRAFHETEGQDYEPDTGMYHCYADYFVWFDEAAGI